MSFRKTKIVSCLGVGATPVGFFIENWRDDIFWGGHWFAEDIGLVRTLEGCGHWRGKDMREVTALAR